MRNTIGRRLVKSAALGSAVAVMISGGPAPEIHSAAPPAFDDKTVVLPGFPIRIDRAWVIEKDVDLTDEDKWVIWIGHEY